MSYTKSEQRIKIEALSALTGLTYESIRRRSKIYRYEKDWDIKPSTKNPIKLKKGVVSNGLKIVSGHPIRSTRYYSYRVDCEYCGANYGASINNIIGGSARNCCGKQEKARSARNKQTSKDLPLGSIYHPPPSKLKKYSALVVRYWDTTIDGCLCNSCSVPCHEVLYECQCNRVDIVHKLRTTGNCALARCDITMSSRPNMSTGGGVHGNSNDLGITEGKSNVPFIPSKF